MSPPARPAVERITETPAAAPRILPVILGVAMFFLVFTGVGNAATFPDSCTVAGTDTSTCERVDYLAQRSDEIEKLIGWGIGAILFLSITPLLRGVTGGNT